MFNSNASDRKIYVPTASVASYKAETYWSSYADYIEGYDFVGNEDDNESGGAVSPDDNENGGEASSAIVLVEGDNSTVGIQVYQHLLDTYDLDSTWTPEELSSEDCITIEGGSLESKLGTVMISAQYGI